MGVLSEGEEHFRQVKMLYQDGMGTIARGCLTYGFGVKHRNALSQGDGKGVRMLGEGSDPKGERNGANQKKTQSPIRLGNYDERTHDVIMRDPREQQVC